MLTAEQTINIKYKPKYLKYVLPLLMVYVSLSHRHSLRAHIYFDVYGSSIDLT